MVQVRAGTLKKCGGWWKKPESGKRLRVDESENNSARSRREINWKENAILIISEHYE